MVLVDQDMDDDELVPNIIDFSDSLFNKVNKDYLSMVSWNVNSILADKKLDELKFLLKEANIAILFPSKI